MRVPASRTDSDFGSRTSNPTCRSGSGSRARTPYGAADATVGFGEEKTIKIRAVVAAKFVFRGTGALDAAGIAVRTTRLDGSWQDVAGDPVYNAAGWSWKVRCAPGPVRWRVERHPRGTVVTSPPAISEGTIEVGPGTQTAIPFTFGH
jgi:hypothetical protein